MPYLGNELATQFQAFVTQTITGDGSTGYTLDRAVANGKELLVYINNVKQEEGSGKSYTASGTTITFSDAVASTDSCYVVFLGSAVQTVVPPAGSIVSSMFANSGLTLPSTLDVDAGITVDNITIDGTEIDLSSGDLTVDVAGDIIFDADGGDFIFKDGGSGDEANKLIRFSTPSHDTDEENVQILQVENEGSFNQISFGGGTSALNASTKLRFLTAAVDTTTGVERISIDSSGNIVFNDTSVDSDFRVESNGNTAALFVDGGNNTVVCGANAPSCRFDANLEVTAHGGSHRGGIINNNFQAASTDAVFEFNKSRNDTLNSHTVVQSGDNIGSVIFRGSDGSAFVDAAAISCQVDGTPGSNDMPGRLGFFTTADGASSPTERMRIDNNGGISLGDHTDTPTTRHSQVRQVLITDTSTTGTDAALHVSRPGTGTETQIVFSNGFGVAGTIKTVGNNTTQYNTSTDYRLKENVVTDWDATTRLKQLKPSRFNFKKNPDKKTVDGFIAHEVSSIVPEAISGEKDEVDKDGNPVYQGIDQSKLVPLLVKTIQELEARIATLESK